MDFAASFGDACFSRAPVFGILFDPEDSPIAEIAGFSVGGVARCRTGLAQPAAVCFRLAAIGGTEFAANAGRNLGILVHRHEQAENFSEAHPGGGRQSQHYRNRGLKVFIDAKSEQDAHLLVQV